MAALVLLAAALASLGSALAAPGDLMDAEAPAPVAPTAPCKKVAAGVKINAQFGAKVTLTELAIWIHEITCKPVVFASELGEERLSVTVIGGSGMTLKDATTLFGNAVEAAGMIVREKSSGFLVLADPKVARACPPAEPQAALGKALEKGITTVDESHVKISRAVLKELMDNAQLAAKGARVVPSVKDGKSNGFKLYAIRPDSVYARLGLRNGDTVTAVNGVQLDSAEKALSVYDMVRDGKSKAVNLDLIRRGAVAKLKIELVD